MAMGYQNNNYSMMGQGQPKKKMGQGNSWSQENFPEQSPLEEGVAPGIPAAAINSVVDPQQNPVNNKMPIGQAPQIHPLLGIPNTYGGEIFQGFTPNQRMEGFDFNRLQQTGKSAKDAFAHLSQQAAAQGNVAPLDSLDKQAYGNWFNQFIAPGLKSLGHNVESVDGDKFTYNNHEGRYTVDFGRGAGAPGGALAWQAEDANAPLPTSAPANDLYKKFQSQLMPQQEQNNDLEELLQILMSQNQELI
jgi:hypothetical protein